MKNNSFLIDLKKGQEIFNKDITFLVNSLFLTLVYFVGVGMTSIFARFFRRKFLKLKKEKINSYWKELNLSTKKKGEYYRLF